MSRPESVRAYPHTVTVSGPHALYTASCGCGWSHHGGVERQVRDVALKHQSAHTLAYRARKARGDV